MAIHATSTPAPERLLLRDAAAPGRLLPADHPTAARRADLLAILDAGPITPDDLTHLSRQRRKSALLGVEALIDLLDALDAAETDLEPDADLEDGGDTEPNLGAPERGLWHSQASWACGNRADLEEVNEDGGDINDQPHDEEPDNEPSLGWSEGETLDQRWSWGFQGWDREEDGWRRPRRRPSQPPVSAPLPDRIGNIRVIGFVQ